MKAVPLVALERDVLHVAGADAHTFLQGLITNDMDLIAEAGAGYAGLLTPQGKIMFDFLLVKTDSGYLLDIAHPFGADLLKRFSMYVLRSAVTLQDVTDTYTVYAAPDLSAPNIEGALVVADPRLAAMGHRVYIAGEEAMDRLDLANPVLYDTRRIALGVPEAGKDFAYNAVFPHDVNMDLMNGLSFTKGCYVGQEVVSRMKHRGTVRKRTIRVEADDLLPSGAVDITASGKAVGSIGAHIGLEALALVRLDKIAAAKEAGTPLLAGDVVVEPLIPDYADFTLN